jgi:predicted PurR-regulated permease PerM
VNSGDYQSKVSTFITLAAFVLVAAILKVAKGVFVPIALAALLSFLLAPLMLRFMRWGMNRTAAIVTTVVFSFSIIGVIGWLVTTQAMQLLDQLPNYQQNLQKKIAFVRHPQAPGFFQKASGMVKELKKEFETKPEQGPTAPGKIEPADEPDKPVPVEVKPPKPSPLQLARNVFGPLVGPLGTAAIVVLLVIMILFQREDLRDRFIKLISGGQLNVATQAVDDAAQRLSRYLLTTLFINATYGIPVGIGLWLIGVPNAPLWGLLAILLRFIPFLGPWIAAVFPLTLSIAVDPGWTKVLMTGGLIAGIEIISNNFVEPWLYGNSTGVSKLALIAAAVFWTWLWGAVGLFLSTPLTVCLMVMGKYVPGLNFLSVLLGSEPVLEPEARFYQRMLAMDEEEMLNIADEHCEQHSVEAFYDDVLIPALILAEQDRHNGALAEVRQQFILQSTRDLIQDLYERDSIKQNAGDTLNPELRAVPRVLCIPAKDDADELAGLMLRHVLTRQGYEVKVFSIANLPAEIADTIRAEGAALACVSAVPPAAVVPARSICKRLKEQFPNLPVIVGIWSSQAQPLELTNRFSHWTAAVLTRLSNAAARIEETMQGGQAHRASASSQRPHFAPRAAEPEELLDHAVREAAKIFNVPVSLIFLARSNRRYWETHLKASTEEEAARGGGSEVPDGGLCNRVETAKQVMVVEDINRDSRLADMGCFKDRGIRFFAGAPLCNGEGHPVGTLWVTDSKPHQVSERQKEAFGKIAERLMEQLNGGQRAAA